MAKKRNRFAPKAKRGSLSRGSCPSPSGFSGPTQITGDCGNPLPVEVISDCEKPLFVEICPQSIGIETALAELGCILDADGSISGKVFLCKVNVDEEGSQEQVKAIAYYMDGTVEPDYTGPWSVCENPQVDIEKFEYCNVDTGTKWIRECQYVTIGVVTTKTILDEFDTGFPCVESFVIENDYCISQ